MNMKIENEITVAIYARYSTDLQNDRSIEDQVRDCKNHAQTQGWKVVKVYSDAAVSGSTLFRPSIQELLADASKGKFQVVLAEALDRVSRDLGDTANLHRHLAFHNVRLVTLTELDITTMHMAFKGAMNAQFLTDLAVKIRRGQRGSVAKGLFPAGLSYGYEVVREFDAQGEPVRGKRRIKEAQAEVIRQVFTEYVGGMSPYEIVRRLNAKGIPSARGGAWNVSSLVGHRKRKVGLFHNELYAGRLIYNRVRMVKDPTTGKRLSRENPSSAWSVFEVPDLRIIDQITWENAQAMIMRNGGGPLSRHARRPKHLLSGLITCADCKGSMIGAGRKSLICSNAHSKRTCASGNKVNREALERGVLEHLRELLAHPDALAEFVKAYQAEASKHRKADAGRLRTAQAELNEIKSKISRLVALVENGTSGSLDSVMGRLGDLELRKTELEIALKGAPRPITTFDANPQKIYLSRIADLQSSLVDDEEDRNSAISTVRSLVERITVYQPRTRTESTEVQLRGRLADFLGLGIPARQHKSVSDGRVYLVAEEGCATKFATTS
jgi:site-specific DNA recombinase